MNYTACIYSGSVSGALPHFEQLGHALPPFVNPAEILIDLAAVDNRTEALEHASQASVEYLKSAWKSRTISKNKEATEATETTEETTEKSPTENETVHCQSDSSNMKSVSFRRQFDVLNSRTFKTTIRDPLGVAGSLLETVGMSVINGWTFLQLSQTRAGIRSRQGSLYTASNLNGYIILLYETYRLTIDIQLFDRERSEGVVGVPEFLLSRRAARLLLEDIPVPFIFAIIYYFVVGYRLRVGQLFVFLALTLLTHYIAVTIAAVAIGALRSFPAATLVANLSFTLQSFAYGYFLQYQQIPVYVRWLK
ncbi:ABC transporter [Aspergillus sp. HF37]|nr:ABC transporter [Aspergillus sp. HF37]